MRKIAWINLLFTLVYSSVFNAFFLGGWLQNMEWWKSLLLALCPAVVSSVASVLITAYTCRKSQMNQNTNAISSMEGTVQRIGNKIVEDMGKTPNDATLTYQHKQMQALLEKEIVTSEKRYTDAENRIRSFTLEQHMMSKKVDEFRLFLDSWERLASDNNALQAQIDSLTLEVTHLKRQLYAEKHLEEDCPDWN